MPSVLFYYVLFVAASALSLAATSAVLSQERAANVKVRVSELEQRAAELRGDLALLLIRHAELTGDLPWHKQHVRLLSHAPDLALSLGPTSQSRPAVTLAITPFNTAWATKHVPDTKMP
jgi:hypothetical protein